MATLDSTPPKPTLSLTESSDDSLKVSWMISDLLRYEILRYDVLALTTGDPTQELVCLDRPILSTQCQLNGLTPKTEYNVSVRACNKAGCGAYDVLLVSTSSASFTSSFTVVLIVFLLLLFIVCCSANYDILWPSFREDCMKGRLSGLFRRFNIDSFNFGRSHHEQDQPLGVTRIHSTVVNASCNETTPFPSFGPPAEHSFAPPCESLPSSQAAARSNKKGLLRVEVHSNSQMDFSQSDDKPTAQPLCNDKQMDSPQCEKN